MAVTIVSARLKTADQDTVPFGNAKADVVKLSGTIASSDTGTYTPSSKTLKDSTGKPVVVGLPHGIQATEAAGLITFTASAAFTSMDVKVLILLEK